MKSTASLIHTPPIRRVCATMLAIIVLAHSPRAQLIDIGATHHEWSNSFDENPFSVQLPIDATVVGQLAGVGWQNGRYSGNPYGGAQKVAYGPMQEYNHDLSFVLIPNGLETGPLSNTSASSTVINQFVSGHVKWTFSAIWDLSYYNLSGGTFGGEQWRIGLGGNAMPQPTGTPDPRVVYLGYDTRSQVQVFDPTIPGLRTIVPLGWNTSAGASMLPVGTTAQQLLDSEIVFGDQYDLQVNIDLALGVVDVKMGPHGGTLVPIGGFKLTLTPHLSPPGVPFRFDDLFIMSNDADGVDMDSGGFDFLRVDDFYADHVDDAELYHCGDVNKDRDSMITMSDVAVAAQLAFLGGASDPQQVLLGDVDRSTSANEPTFDDARLIAIFVSRYRIPLLCPGGP